MLAECAEIRGDHDRRVERAIRAVGMLRDKFEWKVRMEVEQKEPEELGWDPRLAQQQQQQDRMQVDEDSGSSDEDDEVEGVLNGALDHDTPDARTPEETGV